jgi:hypothetical protein
MTALDISISSWRRRHAGDDDLAGDGGALAHHERDIERLHREEQEAARLHKPQLAAAYAAAADRVERHVREFVSGTAPAARIWAARRAKAEAVA